MLVSTFLDVLHLADLLERIIGLGGPQGFALVNLLHCCDRFAYVAVAHLAVALGIGDAVFRIRLRVQTLRDPHEFTIPRHAFAPMTIKS
jgi:hypothetical protein